MEQGDIVDRATQCAQRIGGQFRFRLGKLFSRDLE